MRSHLRGFPAPTFQSPSHSHPNPQITHQRETQNLYLRTQEERWHRKRGSCTLPGGLAAALPLTVPAGRVPSCCFQLLQTQCPAWLWVCPPPALFTAWQEVVFFVASLSPSPWHLRFCAFNQILVSGTAPGSE